MGIRSIRLAVVVAAGHGLATGCAPDEDDGPCATLGTLSWSERSTAPPAETLVLDPRSDASAFYVFPGASGCTTLYDATGQEIRSLPYAWGCEHMAVDASGDLVFAGEEAADGTPAVRVTKLSPSGSTRWSAARPSSQSMHVIDVEADAAGNVIVIGRGLDGVNEDWVMKFDASGTEQWVVFLADGNGVESDFELAVDGAGDITVARVVEPDGGELVRVERFDPGGQPRWSFDITGGRLGLTAMAVDDAGHAAVAVRKGVGPSSRSLTLIDPDGEALWVRSDVDSPWLQRMSAVAFGPCGRIALAGAWGPSRNIWAAKITMEGERSWSNTLGDLVEDTYTGGESIDAIAVDAQGQTIAVGSVENGEMLFSGAFASDRWLGGFAP